MNHHAILLTVAAVAAISGCSGAPAPTSHRDSADLVGEPVYQPMLVVGMPPLRPVAGSGRPIEAMTARGTPVADVLLGMFKDSDINLLIDQSVQTSNCTFDIKHATIEEAFESLLRSLDLGYEWDGNFLRIRDTVQRTFFVDLLPVSQETSSGGASTGTAPGDKPRTDFWTEIDKVMPQVLGTGKAIVNQSANTIHVEASPASVERLREVIDTTLRRRNAQVSLEARILEVRLNSKHSLGLNWSLLPGQFDSHKVGLLPGGALATQSAASGGTALNIGMLQTGDFSVFLDALAEQGQVRVLSSPRVSTMNNVPANIRVVDQVPVINRDIVDVQGVSRTSYAVKFVDAGVSVQVTPMIGEDGMITVDVKPQVTEQTGTVVTPDGLIEEPILSTRETSTIVRVADGQAIALGGLRSTRKDETRQGIPFLMDVPMLGQLFSSTVQSRTEVELMILLVPRILDSSWIDEEIRRGEHRLVNLRRPFQWNSIQLESHRPEDWGAGALQIAPFAAAEPSARVQDAEPPPAATGKNLSVTRDGLAGRLLVRAQKAIDEGQHRQAIVWLEEALALAPRRVDALVAAGVLSSRTGNRARAHLWLERAVELAPDDPVALTALGALELLDASPRAAKGHLERAHAAIGTSTSASNLAAAMLLSGETEAARTLLRAAGDAQSPPELHANLAYAELATGNLTAARAAFERALAAGAEPRNPRVNALQRMLQPAPAAGK